MNHRITLLCGVACCASAASAINIPIANADFELPVTAPGTSMPTAAFWTVNGAAGVWYPIPGVDFNFGAGYGGNQVGFIVNGGNMSQVVPAVVMPSTTYTLSTLLGHQLTVTLGTAAFELFAGGTDVLNVILDPSTVVPGMFEQRSGSWTSTAAYVGMPLSVQYQSLGGVQVTVDNAGLQAAAVPEPCTMAAFCIGGLLLTLRRRRIAR